MDLHPAVLILIGGLLGIMATLAVVWFFTGYGAWMNDAFENGRWVWFGLLLLFTFPASLFAWLIMRFMQSRRGLAI